LLDKKKVIKHTGREGNFANRYCSQNSKREGQVRSPFKKEKRGQREKKKKDGKAPCGFVLRVALSKGWLGTQEKGGERTYNLTKKNSAIPTLKTDALNQLRDQRSEKEKDAHSVSQSLGGEKIRPSEQNLACHSLLKKQREKRKKVYYPRGQRKKIPRRRKEKRAYPDYQKDKRQKKKGGEGKGGGCAPKQIYLKRGNFVF